MASDLQGVVSLLFIGGAMVFHSVRSHRRLRAISDTPRSKAESAPQGFVELEGFAWPTGETFRNGEDQEAVYYSMAVQRQETQGTGKSRRRVWVTIYTHVHSEMFYLADPTGLVTIDVTGAEINLESSRKRLWQKLNEEEKMRFAAMVPRDIPGFPPSTGFFGLFATPYRIVENEILVGCPLYATGDFRGFDGESYSLKMPGYTGFSEKVFDLVSRSFKNRNHLLDLNRDGKVSAEEQRKGSCITARIARKKAGGDFTHEKEFSVHGNIGSNEGTKLFLADTSEEHLKSRLGKWLWPKFGAGAAMIAVGLGLIIGPKIQVSFPKRQSARTPAANAYSNALVNHQLCVKGDGHACRYLLSHKSDLQLPAANGKFYENKLSQIK